MTTPTCPDPKQRAVVKAMLRSDQRATVTPAEMSRALAKVRDNFDGIMDAEPPRRVAAVVRTKGGK